MKNFLEPVFEYTGENLEDLLQSEVDMARGWLGSILLARGQGQEAAEEAVRSYANYE